MAMAGLMEKAQVRIEAHNVDGRERLVVEQGIAQA
jgi:hypothetical protein